MTLKEFYETICDLMDIYGDDIEVKTTYERDSEEPPYVGYNEELDCIEIY